MAAEPGRHRLVPDEFDVLVARPGERHHEAPGASCLAHCRVDEDRAGAEVDLRGLAGREGERYGRLGRARGADRRDDASHRRVAAPIAVLAHKGSMDRYAGHAAGDPALDLRAEGLDGGNGRLGAPGCADERSDRRIVGQRRLGLEPTLVGGERPQARGLGPAHQPGAGDLPVGVALAHAHQDTSILEHLESPAAHRLPSRAKSSGG